MIRAGEATKKLRLAWHFLRRRLIHTNLQILYDCNFRCRICDFWKKEYRGRPWMTAVEARAVAARLSEIGPQIVSIGGGEPLLHPEVEDIVSALARRHFPVMITNGWMMTPTKARALWAAGLYEISVSVDYSSAAKHDAQRGRAGAFHRAVAALETLEANRVQKDQRVNMISVIMDDNLAEIEPLLELSRRLGVTYLVTLYSRRRGVNQTGAASGDTSPTLLRLKKAYPEFVALRGYIGRFSEALGGGVAPCYAGKHLLHINPQGDVSLCIDHENRPVANLLTEEPSVVEKKLLERYQSNDCHACWTSCRGSLETLIYGPGRLANLWDYYRMTKSLRLRTGDRSLGAHCATATPLQTPSTTGARR